MLFTIVKNESFIGLLFIGPELTEELQETADSMYVIDGRSDGAAMDIKTRAHRLEKRVAFMWSDDEGAIEMMRADGFKLFRCRDMDTGRPA